MKRIVIFGGTTEGRRLAGEISGAGLEALVCVATEYGEEVLPAMPGIRVRVGRLTPEGMSDLFDREKPDAAVDATHPFAVEVSRNIKEAAGAHGVTYMRLERRAGMREQGENIRYFPDTRACAKALVLEKGNILLTTGSKELALYCEDPTVRGRLYARVLPAVESLQICKEQGLEGKQIIAMQGPFGEELNRALIRQLGIRIMVTKESGAAGGFEEKAGAAAKEGIVLFVIGRPEESEGEDFESVCRKLLAEAGPDRRTYGPQISLIGMGMGGAESLTLEAHKALCEAEYVFGAPRLLPKEARGRRLMPYYLARDILPELEKISGRGGKKAVVLFSGDTGFYSGAGRLRKALLEAGYSQVRILPGISSMSYLAARAGCDWQQAAAFSIHGRGGKEAWGGELAELVRSSRQTFLLLSGAEDVACVGELLSESGLSHVKMTLGYQLSYEDEEILEIGAQEWSGLKKKGLYACFLWNEAPVGRRLSPGLPDQAFKRDKIPMTKEEIRQVALCKLGLREGAVFYDIGSGSGSIAVEAAGLSPGIQVYAIEKKAEAIRLTRENAQRLGACRVQVIEGEAPEALEALPAPTHAFIGGSGGRLKEILKLLVRKNPRIRVVATAVSLETVSELTGVVKEMSCRSQVVMLQASRTREAGAYHLFRAENPVMIATLAFGEEKEE